MNTKSASNGLYFVSEIPRSIPSQIHQPIVKLEASSSPDLPPDAPAQLLRLQYLSSNFEPYPLDSHSSSGDPSEPGTPVNPSVLPSASLLHFSAPTQTYQYMSTHSWPSSSIGSPDSVSGPSDHTYRHKLDYATMHHGTVAFEDYDEEVSELVDMTADASRLGGLSSHMSNDKSVRRRSSKACDQCRKSKCKCERASLNEPCRSCVTLGTACTFLGPSRKRGPPKGYIDAIEARLHQTEALLGIIMSAGDDRSRTLLHDISKDPLAKEIIKRVDNSSYGPQGRKRGDSAASSKRPLASSSESVPPHSSGKFTGDKIDLQSTHPSNDWQDHVLSILRSASISRGTLLQGDPDTQISPTESRSRDVSSAVPSGSGARPILRVQPPGSHDHAYDDSENRSPGRRQRRRMGTDDPETYAYMATSPRDSASPVFLSRVAHGSTTLGRGSSPKGSNRQENGHPPRRRGSSSMESASSGSEDELPEAVGQLSLNEDAEVRYHGKASGLYLLGSTERSDGRNEGGIWRFPKARVWPPLPDVHGASPLQSREESSTPKLPGLALQEHLLELYFTYVHPSFPIIHKKTFFEDYKMGSVGPEESHSPAPDPHAGSPASPTPPYSRRRRRIPVLLLLTIFSVAARFETTTNSSPPYPSDASTMWAAGDEYLGQAKILLDNSYSSSRPATCQALLLMGYREIGIGAMAQAWTYIGMAIRMAQDLGIHRSADGWARAELGGRLFSDTELHERKRIWYGCVIMDKYVSTYIGRPLSIYESNFDTPLPDEDEPDEHDMWKPHPSQPVHGHPLPPVSGRLLSCFNASACLSNILGQVVEGIYAIRPRSSRHGASSHLERVLDKWYIDLPEHLRYDPGSSKYTIPPPHILNLHMQYWCTVILLHRPFIRRMVKSKLSPVALTESEARALAERSYNLCSAAANHITTIINDYIDYWCIKRGAVFLCYYVFTASLMHITTLSSYPNDPQAQVGLVKCMDALRRMEVVWPSAARALELVRGSKFSLEQDAVISHMSNTSRRKRSADSCLDDLSSRSRTETQEYLGLRSQGSYDTPTSTSPGLYSNTEGDGSSIRTPYFPSYERWTSDNAHTNIPFSGPLSTSVLPQLYSTGLSEDRTVTTSSRSHSNPDPGQSHGQRVPQFWNDDYTLTAYGNLPQDPAAHGSSSMYIPEQYGVYGNNQPPPRL